jgi:hypothetical protein
MTRAGRTATLGEAKAQFQKSWDEWKEWANLEEMGWFSDTENRGKLCMFLKLGALGPA